MTITDTAVPDVVTPASSPADPWRRLLRASAGVVAATAVVMQGAGRFVGPSFVILAVGCAVGASLPRQRRRGAAWTIGLLNVASLLLHGPMAVMAVLHPEAGLAAVLSVANTAASLSAVVGAVAVLRRPVGGGYSRAPARLGAGVAAAVALFTVVSVVTYVTRERVVPAPDEAVLTHEGLSVTPSAVVVEDDAPTLVVRNADPLYVRSFDIDRLDLHVLIPPRTAVRVAFPGGPATYSFYDFVTFTPATKGVVTVR